MRLIRVRALPFLQIFDIGLKIPLELRPRNRGYDGIGAVFIGETAAGRVVHLCHEPMVVTEPLVTDLAIRPASRIWASVLARGMIGSDDGPGNAVLTRIAFARSSGSSCGIPWRSWWTVAVRSGIGGAALSHEKQIAPRLALELESEESAE